MLTIREHLGRLGGVKFVYMGDARYNMGNSLMVTCAKLGMDFVACTNKKYFPNDELVKYLSLIHILQISWYIFMLCESVRWSR